MLFEARNLKPYAEPVSAAELVSGNIYFFISFLDDHLLIPMLEPVVFAGRNFEPDDTDQVYFQDVDSFRKGVRYGNTHEGGDAVFQAGSASELGHVFIYEHALDQLLACSIRRRKMGDTIKL